MKKYILLLLISILGFACKDNVESLASVEDIIDKRPVVELGKVEKRSEALAINAIGRLASDKELRLSFKIGGVIASVSADEGQRVRKGQTLAALRTNEIDAQVLKAKQALDKAERDLERIKRMYDEEAATLENVQDLTTAVEVAEADLEIAEFNQKYAQISSPVNGRVLSRMAEPNELVNPGQPIFLIASNEGKAFVMKVALSDKDITRVDYSDKATVTFDAFPGETFEGRINLIAESADPQTGTFDVELTVDANGKRLRNGYIGRIQIAPQQSAPYYAVPMSALVEADDRTVTIFIPEHNNQIAKEIQVEPLHITSDYFAIKDPGIKDLETVITTGAPYLLDGDSIRIKN